MREEAGFTLVEVMVAAVILVVGVLGTLSMLTFSSLATTTTKAREQGVSLQREIVEAARSIPYDQLVPNGIVSRIQRMPDLGDDEPHTPGWQIHRRGFTYTVSVGACSVDDPSDGSGAVDNATFCPPGGGTSAATCRRILGMTGSIQGTAAATSSALDVGSCGIDLNLDGQVDYLTRGQLSADAHVNLCSIVGWCPSTLADTYPDDYKRIVTLVRWNRGGGSRYALQSTTVPNPGSAAAPQMVSLTAPSLSVTAAATTSVTFAATTSRTPAAVSWSVDGTATGTATGVGTAWGFTWNLGAVSAGSTPNTGEVLDGAYVVSAKAFDSYGSFGQTKAVTLTVNRRVPYAPAQFAGGRNPGGSGGTNSVDFEWAPNKERDIVGYRVYRVPTLGAAVQVCPATSGATTSSTTCEATNEPNSATVNYYAVAYDRDTAGNVRAGDVSPTIVVTGTNNAPLPPGTLSASTANGNTVLSWGASAGDPDVGDQVAFYRIYRDGQHFADRYDRTGTGAELTYTDTNTNGVQHDYSVVAVDTQLAESTFSNTVTR